MQNINEIKSDSYAKKFVGQPTPLFKKGWKEIEIPDFPENYEKEIEEILKQMQSTTAEEKKLIRKYDKKDPPFELDFLKIVGDQSKESEKFVYELTGQLFTICMYFKNKFDRLRPFEIAKKLKIDFPKIKTETGITPAYPSGHTLNSFFLADLLSKKYPNKKKELFDLAETISQGRIQMGVHFPSDIKGGKILAKKLLDYYKPSSEGFSFKEFFSSFF